MAALLLLFLLVWSSVNIWLVVFAGILLAIFLRGLANWVSVHMRLPPILALIVVIVGLLALIAFGGWLLAPDAVQQFNELTDRLPKAFEQLRQRLQEVG